MASGGVGGAPPAPARGSLLVLGPPSSGRSGLLFRAALAAASASSASSRSAGRVLFVAPRALQRLPGCGPAAPAAPGPAAPLLQRIQFLYPASLRELLQQLASLHETWPGSGPSLVVLDSLEEYLADCPGPHTAAQLAALLLDTTNHFSQRSAEPAGCRLMVSVRLPGEDEDEAEQVSAVQRYFLAQVWLHPETPESGSSDGQEVTKLVRARLSQPGTHDQEWLLRFEPQGEMKISPLLCPRDGGASPGSKRSPAAETHANLDLWWS